MRRLAVVGFMVVILVMVIPIVIDRTPDPDLSDDHSIWLDQTTNHYQMNVEAFAPPVPPVALRLTVRDGEIINESIIACDQPTEEHPARLCEPVRTWYTYMARYTIEELFAWAESCIIKTRQTLYKCPDAPDGFRRFDDPSEMFQVARSCEAYVQGFSDALCTVLYHPFYGYPEEITSLIPGVSDGVGVISIHDFQFLDE